jgi:penicillin-binding protein 1C
MRERKAASRSNLPILGLPALACLVSAAAFYALLLQPVGGIPSSQQVRAAHVPSEGILLDRNGETVHELRTDKRGRRLEWTPLEKISPALKSAVVFAEDRRFYRHRGVDWISLGRALTGVLRASRAGGASTITMQVAARLDEELKPGRNRRSFFQKSRQIRSARTYEKSWSKSQILEAYMNLVTFRGELQGVHAAARGLFSKEPQGLNEAESAVLAALVRSPNAEPPSVALRAAALAKAMGLETGREEIERAASAALSRPYDLRPRTALAPHVAHQLLQADGTAGGRIAASVVCTLDGGLQAFALETLRRQILSVRTRNVRDGAALVVENKSGDVLAYVGNTGEESSARFVDGVRAMRQAGSTLKPFVYALAFDRRIFTPASLIDDSPLDIPVQGGVYRPQNYDNRFHGMVTARIALASSLNVPAVKTLHIIGVTALVEILRALGFRDIRTPDYYGPALALGSVDVTLWDLVNAYRTLANSGIWSPLRLTVNDSLPAPRRVFSPESVFLVSDILSDRESRSLTFALENPLSTRFWTAVKTGTSKDMRDNWCIGFSDRYTVGVWAGNFSGEPMRDVSGIAGAAPVWIELMNRLHREQSSRKPGPPAGLVRRGVEIASGAGTKQEWFIEGTDTTTIKPAEDINIVRIAYPTSGTIIALDPDIPPEAQKIFFGVSPQKAGLEWVLDGLNLGPAASLKPWSPCKGKHVLKLVDPAGTELDSVDFEVRGN